MSASAVYVNPLPSSGMLGPKVEVVKQRYSLITPVKWPSTSAPGRHTKKANRLFTKTISDVFRDNDLNWVHYYNLMLPPEMLRKELARSKQSVKAGFFLHTPFPSREIYRILPVRNGILLGVSHCGIIGLHTYDYTRHFLSSCSRLL